MTISTTEQEPRSLSRRRLTVIGDWLQSDAAGSVVPLLLGVVGIAVGTSWIINNRHLMQTGVRTTGVVVANRREDGRSGPEYLPQVRYVVPGKHTYVVEGETALNPPEFRVGDSATVYYDPRHPQTALVDSALRDANAWIIIVVGWVCVLIAGAWLLVCRLLLGTPTTQTTYRRQRASTHTGKSNIRRRRSAPARRHR
jgi:hypothetical protein